MNKFRYHPKFEEYKAGMAGIALTGIICVAVFVGCVTYINIAETVVDHRPFVFMGLSIVGLFFNQWLWSRIWNNLGEIDTK
jgi:hypothetical protein